MHIGIPRDQTNPLYYWFKVIPLIKLTLSPSLYMYMYMYHGIPRDQTNPLLLIQSHSTD